MSHAATCTTNEHVHDHDSVRPSNDPTAVQGASGPRSSAVALIRAREWVRWLDVVEVRWALTATLLFGLAVGADAMDLPSVLVSVLYLGCYLSGGWEPGLAGLTALRDRSLDVDLLMIVAAIGAAAIGQRFDGALLIVIFATSGALEAAATTYTRKSVRSLLTLAPETAAHLEADGTEVTVPTSSLQVGQLIVVRPGERIGADGTVVDGSSDVDEATISGEPLPVAKVVGDPVFAGCLNGNGVMRIAVDRPAADSVVARIVRLVEEASATKAKAQLFIDRVEQRYSVTVVAATLGLFVGPLIVGSSLQPTLLRAMTFMIVASPCAVVLATMPPLLSAIANAGRHGVLVKSAVVMERLGTISQVCLDKTGTLTVGTPHLHEILPVVAHIDAGQLLALAASAEHSSEHPLGASIVGAANERSLQLVPPTEFSARPGHGIVATIGEQRIEVGDPASWAGRVDGRAERAVDDLHVRGLTAVIVVADSEIIGVLGLSDTIRVGAAATVGRLTAIVGRTPILLTGDHIAPARRVASEIGISDIRAGLLPADKLTAVRGLESQGLRVLMVGDGVNDAPSLAGATLGAAMHGSDLALETADLVLVRDDLSAIPAAIELSRRAHRVVVQNLTIAALVIVSLVAVNMGGHLPLALGVAGHEGSTIIVALNGLRLLHNRSWHDAR